MKKYIGTLALLATIFAGCSKNEAENTIDTPADDNALTIHATIEQPTRISLDEGTEAALVKWNKYDLIAIVMKQASENALDLIESDSQYSGYIVNPDLFSVKTEGVTEAEFRTTFSDENITQALDVDTYYAVYPFRMIGNTGQQYTRNKTKYTLTLANEQVADFATNFKNNGAMVAKAVDAPRTGVKLAFKNLHAILKFAVTGDKKLDRIVFHGNDNEGVAGSFSVDFANDDFAKADFSAATAKEIKLSCNKQLTAEPQTFYMIVPARTYAKGYTVEFIADDGEKIAKSAGNGAEKTLKRATIYTLPTVDFKAQGGSEATVDWLWQTSADLVSDVSLDEIAGATDLGAGANCYMVNAAGAYKFPIAKGDGSAVNADLAGKYIYFKASAAKGNAVIALKVNDQIAWSWHIWATDAVCEGAAAAGHIVLDRNLGATTTEIGQASSLGLYYQWGRKDPFIGAKSVGAMVSSGNTAKITESTAFGTLTASYVGNGDAKFKGEETSAKITDCVGYTVANPMTFLVSNAEVNKGGTLSWFTSDYTTFNDLWGGVSKQKSAYDPCPAGYKVPEDSNVTWAGYTKTKGLTFTELGATDSASGITYPLTGVRDAKGCIGTLGQLSYIPSAKMAIVSSSPKATALQITYSKTSATGFLSNFVNPNFTNKAHVVQGYAVRCEKIQ